MKNKTKIQFLAVSAAILAIGLSHSYAQCCPGKSKGQAKGDVSLDASKKGACGSACLSNLNLSEDQKSKVDELAKACDAKQCSYSNKAKFHEGLKDILTARQYQQMKDECAKKGCSFTSAEKDEQDESSSTS